MFTQNGSEKYCASLEPVGVAANLTPQPNNEPEPGHFDLYWSENVAVPSSRNWRSPFVGHPYVTALADVQAPAPLSMRKCGEDASASCDEEHDRSAKLDA
jgi:hypothetical protein